jgi:hypothetical protein
MQDHLKENGLKLEDTDYIVGRTLNFDSKTESIIGDDQANDMLSRSYRSPICSARKSLTGLLSLFNKSRATENLLYQLNQSRFDLL